MESALAIDLDRSRSVGELVRSTLRLYGEYPWLFFALAFAVVAPWDLARLAVTGVAPFGRPHVGFVERQSLGLVGLLLVGPLISAMHVHAVVVIGQGRRPSLRTVAWSGLRVFPIVGVAAAVAGVAVEVGLFALIVPGLVLLIRVAVVAQAAAIEQTGVRPALRSSWRLTRDHQQHVVGYLLLVGTLSVGVLLVVRASGVASSISLGAMALWIAIDTMLASFYALMAALLYFDLLARGEQTQAVEIAVSP